MMKGFIFDFDGVIDNTEKFSVKYQKKFGISDDEMQPFFKGIFQKILIGEADLKEEVKPYLKKWKWQGSAEDFLTFWFESEDCLDYRVISAIKEQGKKCFLATDQEKYRMEYIKNKMGMRELMDEIFYSVPFGVRKFKKEFYRKMCEEILEDFSIKKSELVFWDDHKLKVEEAEKFGIKSYLYNNFNDFQGEVNKYLK
jgi:putative hydrolase of the HAD superfamily